VEVCVKFAIKSPTVGTLFFFFISIAFCHNSLNLLWMYLLSESGLIIKTAVTTEQGIYPLYAVMYLIKSLLVVLSISPYNMKCLWEKKSGNEGRSSEPEVTSSADSSLPGKRKTGRNYPIMNNLNCTTSKTLTRSQTLQDNQFLLLRNRAESKILFNYQFVRKFSGIIFFNSLQFMK